MDERVMDAPDLDELVPLPFAVYFPESLPRWLRGPVADRFTSALGFLLDKIVAAAEAATTARMPGLAPDDALSAIGAERQIEATPSESSRHYAPRLAHAWETWEESDSDSGVIDALAVAGFPAHIKRNNQWAWDSLAGNIAHYWARLWVIIDKVPSTWGPPATCGGGAVCGDGTVCGIAGASYSDTERIRRIVKKWSGSHALIPAIIVRIAGGLICGDGASCGDVGAVCGGGAAYLQGW